MAESTTVPTQSKSPQKSVPISDWEWEYEDIEDGSVQEGDGEEGTTKDSTMTTSTTETSTTYLPIQLPRHSLPAPTTTTSTTTTTASLLPPLLELPSGLYKLTNMKTLGSYMILDSEGKVETVCRETVEGKRVSVIRRGEVVGREAGEGGRAFVDRLRGLMEERERRREKEKEKEGSGDVVMGDT